MTGGMETPELEKFMFNRDKEAESTACCIQLACDPSIDQTTARWATFAYFRYGGEPKAASGELSPEVTYLKCVNCFSCILRTRSQ